jgi:hypothetical protein
MLLWGNPIYQLLPQLQVPIGYYAAAGDSDTPLELYVANSKIAKYVSFHVSSGSRYTLLASTGEGLAAASIYLLLDQTLLLVALLADVDLGLIPDIHAADQQGVVAASKNQQGYEQQQQQESGDEGGGAAVAAGRLFPFQQLGPSCSLDDDCVEHDGRAVHQQHAAAVQVCN